MLHDDYGLLEVLKHQVDNFYISNQLLKDVQENVNRKMNRFIASSSKNITCSLDLGMGILQNRKRKSENVIVDFEAIDEA